MRTINLQKSWLVEVERMVNHLVKLRVCQNDAPSFLYHKAPTFTSWGFDIS